MVRIPKGTDPKLSAGLFSWVNHVNLNLLNILRLDLTVPGVGSHKPNFLLQNLRMKLVLRQDALKADQLGVQPTIYSYRKTMVGRDFYFAPDSCKQALGRANRRRDTERVVTVLGVPQAVLGPCRISIGLQSIKTSDSR